MKIIPKPELCLYPGQTISADRITFLPSAEGIVLRYVDSFSLKTWDILLDKVAEIIDSQTYDNKLSGH